jgi:predicted amidohydrolase YtcJ
MEIFYNGIIDSLKTRATGIAIDDKRIIAIGTDSEVLALETPVSKKIDLAGKTVWPGLIDSHLHFDMYSQSLEQVKCETNTIEECLKLVDEKSKHSKPEEWIIGQGWNQNTWGTFGTANQLDLVSSDHPVFLADKSIHAVWVNSKALQIANINKTTPNPDGGSIQRDLEGNPTGILFENAVALVEKQIPAISPVQRLDYFRRGQKSLHKLGLIGIHDFDRVDCFTALQEMNQSGELTLRVTKGIPFEDLEHTISMGLRTGTGNEHLHIGSLKLFADGALGPQTAAMLRQYEGTNDKFGVLLLTADEVFEIGMKATSNGLSMAIHAIGDKATNEVLNGYAMVRQYELTNHIPQRAHRIEHLQLLHPDNLQKVKDAQIIASMQPIHILSDMDTADKHWGARARLAYAFGSLLKLGVPLIFGSDAPVESPNPFVGISAAVTRRRQDIPDSKSWYPVERISVEQAKHAYSKSPADVSGYGSTFGQLKVGLSADFLMLAKNPETMDPNELFHLHPEKVFVDGRCVYED